MYDNSSQPNTAQDETRHGGGSGRTLPLSSSQPVESEHTDIYDHLRRLEELPERARGLFGHRVLIGFDYETFQHLVLKIRADLPQDVKQARRIRRDEGTIVAEARKRAEQIVAEAQESARQERDRAAEDGRELKARAERDAQDILSAAREEAARMVEESEVMRVAKEQARQLVESAAAEADEIRRGANQYARDVLANLDAVLEDALGVIRRGQEKLAERD